MDFYGKWVSSQYFIQVFSSTFSIIANIFLIFLIIFKSTKFMGSYKVLLGYTSIYELSFAILDIIIAPSCFTFDSMLVLYATNIYFSPKTMRILLPCYTGMFGISLGIFPVLFIYRFLVLTKNKSLITFESRIILFWLFIPLLFGFMFGATTRILAAPHDIKTHHFQKYLTSLSGIPRGNITYLSVFFESTNAQYTKICSESILAIILMNILVIYSLILIIHFGIKCYNLISKNLNSSNLSQECRNIQTQFFYALVVQTIIPIVLLHFPAAITLLSAVFNIDLGFISGIPIITLAIFPAVDPLPTIFIIKSYRNATKCIMLSLFRFLKKSQVSSQEH